MTVCTLLKTWTTYLQNTSLWRYRSDNMPSVPFRPLAYNFAFRTLFTFRHITNQATFSRFRYVLTILKEKRRIMEDING